MLMSSNINKVAESTSSSGSPMNQEDEEMVSRLKTLESVLDASRAEVMTR